MRTPGRRIGRVIVAIAAVGLILLSTVASHGCRVQGSNPAPEPAAQAIPATPDLADARATRPS